MTARRQYRAMLRIRRIEERLLDHYSQGRARGTMHACIGQEANAVGVLGQLDPARDYVVSNHRCHGHFLAFGGPMRGLAAEVMGLDSGVCGGRGGSQHLKHGNFLSNGIQGGGAPIACGLAMAGELLGGDGIVASCLGDGTLGQGVLYESLNMASLWNLPVLFLVEANGLAQSTPTGNALAGDMAARGEAFGIRSQSLDSSDVAEIAEFAAREIEYVRKQRRPVFLVIHTCRLCAHSKSDDTREPEELAALQCRDPLAIQAARLDARELESMENEVGAEVEAAFQAEARP